MERNWIDSEGNKAEIVLFSELEKEEIPFEVEDENEIVVAYQKDIQNLLKEVKEQQRIKEKREVFVKLAMSLLTPKQKQVVHMKFWGRLNNKEIAKKVKISPKAVQYRMDGALKKLKKYLV